MPAATAWAGVLIDTFLPSTTTSPDCARSAPNTARATSVRPAPISPAKPRISPRRKEKATFRTSGPQLRFLTSSAISLRGGCAARIGASLSFLPTIMEMIVSMLVVAVGTVPTYSPSRRTVTRSEICFSSSILWEM